MSGKLNVPEKLGKYEIRGTLGRGAMGLVYDGWDPVIGRQVAIKTVRLAGADDEEAVEGLARFKREAQAAGRMSHPNIVGVFDYGETDELAYIVMEFVPGGSLKEVLDRKETLSVPRVCGIMAQILSALAFSHARGVVHRDIKPANIMLTAEGGVKLADFGIARIESSGLTSVGVVLGTPAYMAPEQFLGEPADARSDLYAAGATFFHLLTGTRPYDGNPTSIMQRVINAEVPPVPSERAARVPPGLDGVIRRAMARRPEDRFQDATAFAAAMLAALSGAPPPPAPPPQPPPEPDAESTLVLNAAAPATPEDSDGTIVEQPPAPPAVTPQPPSTPPKPEPAAAAAPPAKGGGGAAFYAGIGIAVLAAGGIAAYLLTQKTPSPVPAPPVAEIAKPAPAPTPPKPAAAALPKAPDPVQLATAVTHAVAGSPCALLRASAASGGVTVTGVAGAGGPDSAAHALATKAAGNLPVQWNVRNFTGPFCPTLETIRPAFNAGALTLSLQGGITAARAGMVLQPAISGLDFPAYVRVESLDSTGANYHIYPTLKDGKDVLAEPASLLPAGATLTLGGPGKTQWTVAPPFGNSLLVAVASSEQLLAAPRRNDEPMGTYLADLGAAIAAAQAHGAKLAAGVLMVDLSAK